MEINKHSRLSDDKPERERQAIMSERPLQWYTSNISANRALEYGDMMHNIDASVTLRAKPTRSNNLDDIPSTELMGTAPYKGLRDGPIDVESQLIYGSYVTRHDLKCTDDNRIRTHTLNVDSVPLTYHDGVQGVSTRAHNRTSCQKKF
jgi:hypothetical protein